MEIIDVLQNSELFAGIDKSHLTKVSDYCIRNSYNQGTIIFKEGQKATELYILADGRVVLEMEVRPMANQPGVPTAVETITAGGAFGWSTIVEPYIYTRSARCITNCAALVINGQMLSKLMADDTVFGFELMKRLAALISLRLTNTRLRLVGVIGIALLEREVKS